MANKLNLPLDEYNFSSVAKFRKYELCLKTNLTFSVAKFRKIAKISIYAHGKKNYIQFF